MGTRVHGEWQKTIGHKSGTAVTLVALRGDSDDDGGELYSDDAGEVGSRRQPRHMREHLEHAVIRGFS